MPNAIVPNRYAGTCIRCGVKVPAEQGTHRFAGSEDHRLWPQTRLTRSYIIVEHLDCAAKYDGTKTHHIYHPIEENN